MTITTTEAATLNLLSRCTNRLGKSTVLTTDCSIELDLWYNYYDQREFLEVSLTPVIETLATKGLIEHSPEGYKVTEAGKSLNTRLTENAEAHATALWEDSELCKSFRQKLYGRQMQILSQQASPEDVPLFNLMSEDHANVIHQHLQTLIPRHERLNILDFGCGVMSRVPELLMQRPDMPESTTYCFADKDPHTLERLHKKHKERANVQIINSDYDSLATQDIERFQLILAIDVLYFIRNDGDARTSAVQALFNKLVVGGLLIFSMGAAPKLCPEELAELTTTEERLLPVDHPRSGLDKVMHSLRATPQARMKVLAEPYRNSWHQFAVAFAEMPHSSDSGLERIRFETAQVMKKIEDQKDMPAGRWTVFVEKT